MGTEMAYDIPWTPAPNNKLLTLADVWHQPTVSDMLQLAAFRNASQEGRYRNRSSSDADEAAGRSAEAPWAVRPGEILGQAGIPTITDLIERSVREPFDATKPHVSPWNDSSPRTVPAPASRSSFGPRDLYDPRQSTGDPDMPGYMGIGRPNAFLTPPDQTGLAPHNPATDPARLEPLPSYNSPAGSAPMEPMRSTGSQGRSTALTGQYERYLATALKMMESDNPAIMNRGLRLLHSVNQAAGNAVELPESLPDSRGFTDYAKGVRSILADKTLDPSRNLEALSALSTGVRGGREETAGSPGPAIDMGAIEAELARRGVA